MEEPGVERGLVLEGSLVLAIILTQRTAILRVANVSTKDLSAAYIILC